MRYFFVGIGGVSMSALAKLLAHNGHEVSGSDIVASENTAALTAMGIKVYLGHQASNLQAVDYLVLNGAIADDNPELLAAKKLGIKIIYREELLATIANQYQQVVAIAGCHGKSSTTAMIGQIYQQAGRQPTIHNGVKSNLQIGNHNTFITEACEFRKSFLKLKPTIAVVTNVDADHLDCYKNLADIKRNFAKFARQADYLVKNADDPNSVDLFGKKQTFTFGINHGDVHTKNLQISRQGYYQFDLVITHHAFGQYWHLPRIVLSVPGRHNVYNALAAITCGLVAKIDVFTIQQSLAAYRGIARRFEQFGTLQHTPVILDYAHHPRELATMLATANTLYQKYLVVFQPHTYTRTLALWSDFVQVLSTVKHLVIYKTYAARGKVMMGGRGLDLSKALAVKYIANVQTLKKFLVTHAAEYDAIILCGAGDVVSGNFLQAENLLATD